MTPAIAAATKRNIPFTLHHYSHDPNHSSFGLEAAEKLHITPDRVFKTLVIRLDDASLAVTVLPVSSKLNLKRAAAACGSKKAEMAEKTLVEKTTGYVLGGVSPLGQKKRLPTIIHASAADHPTVFVSGGRRGLEIELSPADLLDLTGGRLDNLV